MGDKSELLYICIAHQDNSGENWTLSALSPLENLRKQLEKLDDFEEKFPTSVHTDTYLRYPFTKPGKFYLVTT